jgi:Domain of unknown function (DUF4192)
MTADITLPVRTGADLIAAVPYVLGFHPADSLTVVAVRGRRIVFAARADLPDGDPAEVAWHVTGAVARQSVDAAAVLGHGPPGRVTPAVLAVVDALRRRALPVLDALRVTGGRYWSYLCREAACCPPEGRPCPPPDGAIAAAATYAGAVALPDRAALAARLAPPAGAASVAATARARARLAGLATGELGRAGDAAVRAAERRHRSGGRLGDDEVAWLGVLLADLGVRDGAWARTGGEQWRVDLWSDVVRRVDTRYAAAPACLLAFAAWRLGDGALAWLAVDRARAADPDYSMALLMADVLAEAVPPAAVAGWPEIAESTVTRCGEV